MSDKQTKINIDPSVSVISIDADSINVEIETIDSSDSINLINSELIYSDNVRVEQRDNELRIKEQNDNFSKHSRRNCNTIIQSGNGFIRIQNNSNSIIINGINIFSSNSLNNSQNNGVKLVLTRKNDYRIMIKNKSGEVEIKDLKATTLNVKTMSGDIALKNIDVASSKLETKSGDLKVDNLKTNRLIIETMSGDIELDNIDAIAAKLKTVSGDVRTYLLESILNYKIHLSTVSGYTEQQSLETETAKILSDKRELDVTTVSGDIKVLFKGRKN